MGFRALDDIKETVRNAATTLCRTLTSLSARLCDPALTPEADAKGELVVSEEEGWAMRLCFSGRYSFAHER